VKDKGYLVHRELKGTAGYSSVTNTSYWTARLTEHVLCTFNTQSGLAIQLRILTRGTTKLVFRRNRQADRSNALHVYSGGAQFEYQLKHH